MIEINLSPSGKGENNEIQELLSKLNPKMMVIAIAFYFVPEMVYLSIADGEIDSIKAKTTQVTQELNGLNQKVQELKRIENQISALKVLEVQLAEKLEVVKQIIGKRRNPFYILQYLANNTPADLWITDLKLDDKSIQIKGFSDSWKSIGVFLENLKSSIFFEKSMEYVQPKERDAKYKLWERKENFEINAKIMRFE